MFFKEYAPYLELGGLLLALLEFLGVGAILRRFIEWQGEQFRYLYNWLDSETEISLLKTKINNVNYFFLLFTLISSYVVFVKVSIGQVQMTVMAWIVLGLIYVGIYLFIWKVLMPVVQFMLGLYYWILGILINKGVMTIFGLLLAVTSFVVSSAITPSQLPAPAGEVKKEQPAKADVTNANSDKSKTNTK